MTVNRWFHAVVCPWVCSCMCERVSWQLPENIQTRRQKSCDMRSFQHKRSKCLIHSARKLNHSAEKSVAEGKLAPHAHADRWTLPVAVSRLFLIFTAPFAAGNLYKQRKAKFWFEGGGGGLSEQNSYVDVMAWFDQTRNTHWGTGTILQRRDSVISVSTGTIVGFSWQQGCQITVSSRQAFFWTSNLPVCLHDQTSKGTKFDERIHPASDKSPHIIWMFQVDFRQTQVKKQHVQNNENPTPVNVYLFAINCPSFISFHCDQQGQCLRCQVQVVPNKPNHSFRWPYPGEPEHRDQHGEISWEKGPANRKNNQQLTLARDHAIEQKLPQLTNCWREHLEKLLLDTVGLLQNCLNNRPYSNFLTISIWHQNPSLGQRILHEDRSTYRNRQTPRPGSSNLYQRRFKKDHCVQQTEETWQPHTWGHGEFHGLCKRAHHWMAESKKKIGDIIHLTYSQQHSAQRTGRKTPQTCLCWILPKFPELVIHRNLTHQANCDFIQQLLWESLQLQAQTVTWKRENAESLCK